MKEYRRLADASHLSAHVGEAVILVGRMSDTPWQHLVAPPATHPIATYFDVGDFQILVYTKKTFSEDGKVEVRGDVIEVSGRSKSPRSEESYAEYHLVVDEWSAT